MRIGIFEILILIVAPILIGLIVLFIKNPKAGLKVLGVIVLVPVVLFFLLPLLRVVTDLYGGVRLKTISLAFLPLLAILAGLIYLIIKYPKPTLITLGVLALAGVLLTGMFVSHKVVSVSQPSDQPQTDLLKPMEIPPQKLSAVWQDGIEDEFEADVYPSQKAAVRVLGKQVVEMAIKLNGGKEPKWFENSMGHIKDPDVAEEFKRAIEKAKSNPDNPVLTSAKGLEGGVATVGLVLRQSSHRSTSEGVFASGTLEASVLVGGKRTAISLKFDETPWLENFSAFSNSKPGKRYVVVRSTSSCTDAEWASREAMTAATHVLEQKLRDMGVHGSEVNFTDIESRGFVVDKFIQSLNGSASDIWRQAILLDVSGNMMNNLARAKRNYVDGIAAEAVELKRSMTATWVRMLLSLVGLIAVICVVYLIVNVATKGYYTLVLRIVTAAAIIIGVIVLLLMVA